MDLTLTIVDPSEAQVFRPLAVAGFDDVGEVRMVMPVGSVSADGHQRARAVGFQRVVTLALGVVSSVSLQDFLTRWVFAPERSITYGAETAAVALMDPTRVKADTSSGKLFHRFTLQVIERAVRSGAPPSWHAAPITWTSWAQDDIRPFDDVDYTFDSLT